MKKAERPSPTRQFQIDSTLMVDLLSAKELKISIFLLYPLRQFKTPPGYASRGTVQISCRFILVIDKIPNENDIITIVQRATNHTVLGQSSNYTVFNSGMIVESEPEFLKQQEDQQIIPQEPSDDAQTPADVQTDLGGINNTCEAVLYCKEKGIGAYQGGTCNETDRSAQICVNCAMATKPTQISKYPKHFFIPMFFSSKQVFLINPYALNITRIIDMRFGDG